MTAIFKRELRSYFTTPIGYVFMGIFLAVNGGAFSLFTLQAGTDSDVSSYFSIIVTSLIVVLPLLTMKSFSEEKKLRTEQLLMTSPISLGKMVMGKFLAVYTVFAGTFLVGCINFIALFVYGPKNYNGTENIYNGAILIGSVIAVLLVGAAFTAIGIFVSSMTENQIISAIGTIALMGLFLIFGLFSSLIPFAPVREVLGWLSVYTRFANFGYGIFDFTALLYYISICFVFLFLTVRVYEKRRWA